MTDKQGAKAIVLKVSDLPVGSTRAEEALVGKRCDPVTYFGDYATATANPFGFILPDADLLQTVGVFKTPARARKAFVEVTSEAARECVGAQTQRTVTNLTGSPGILSAEDLSRPIASETTKTMRIFLSSLWADAEVQRTAILHGRVLTTLTFISQNRTLSPSLWRSVSQRAVENVEKVSSSIES